MFTEERRENACTRGDEYTAEPVTGRVTLPEPAKLFTLAARQTVWMPAGTVSDGLPIELADARPSGFLGRHFAAAHAGHPPGSSAGGERPKFGVFVDGRHRLVKFAARTTDAVAGRWCDLLVLEALALDVVASRGIPAARTLVVERASCCSEPGCRSRRSRAFLGPGGGRVEKRGPAL